ncbi:hypothetical protein HID58_008234 [Brassica napus]|uniref:F-box domain-containing protein n=2 Tax=Brassica TaxID=3705 RepID=A0A3P5ZPC6_BRACM|nr:putative F-box only protein 15 [Brassica napus]KAH0931117.1 hypothetical protein HID58_008234 [Brassica napus]CAF2118491.1 unnamed protein product [Brassica napus]CAG7878852.1 unnamed protein product [Brassica rapa]VDC78345.1 unnamed protein product [Brassica rapa]
MASSNPSWSSLLPLELLENILLRIPVESLARFKSTCKEWRALLDDKIFIYKHLDLSHEGFIRVTDHNSYQIINLETLSLSSLQGPSKIGSMIHCDGLLLCSIGRRCIEPIKERKLAVWNPFLGQFKRIKPSSSYTWFDIYGFGYDNVSRDNYKILRFKREKGCEEVEIYELKSQFWRSVDYSLAYSWCAWKSQAMSMNGNMYWIAERENDNSKTYFIQSFDFSKEVFKETCCIPFINHNDWQLPGRSGLSPRLSGFGGDRLSLLAQQRSGEIQVWVTNNIVTDEVVSWSMYCNVTPDFRILALHPTYLIHHTDRVKLWFHHTDRVKLWCSEKDDRDECIYASVYEIGEGEVKKQVETERHGWYERVGVTKLSSAFVPSLVPVPKQEETSEGCSC